jgi:hypothetical protein
MSRLETKVVKKCKPTEHDAQLLCEVLGAEYVCIVVQYHGSKKMIASDFMTESNPQDYKSKKCDVPMCTIKRRHVHCPECGSTEHRAADCDMEG